MEHRFLVEKKDGSFKIIDKQEQREVIDYTGVIDAVFKLKSLAETIKGTYIDDYFIVNDNKVENVFKNIFSDNDYQVELKKENETMCRYVIKNDSREIIDFCYCKLNSMIFDYVIKDCVEDFVLFMQEIKINE